MPGRSALLAALLVVAFAACGEGPAASPPAPPHPVPVERVSGDVPPPLARVRREGSRLLEGGSGAFRARLRELRGYPVVVNKWASWCPPCRTEFPFFRSQAARRASRVAFLGVDSQDSEGEAASFLRAQRPGYPSYSDPDLEVAQVFRGIASFPTTAFYDAKGSLVYLKQGGYATEQKLAADIDRYTR